MNVIRFAFQKDPSGCYGEKELATTVIPQRIWILRAWTKTTVEGLTRRGWAWETLGEMTPWACNPIWMCRVRKWRVRNNFQVPGQGNWMADMPFLRETSDLGKRKLGHEGRNHSHQVFLWDCGLQNSNEDLKFESTSSKSVRWEKGFQGCLSRSNLKNFL